MVHFQKIIDSSDTNFIKMYELYRTAFSSSERRNLGGLEHVLNYEKRFNCYALIKEEDFVGFFTWWIFHKFIYVEHFAVNDKMRGQNIGSIVMNCFLSKTTLPVILEVEMPEDADSIRRIQFYEKLGLNTISHTYAQPYYDGSRRLLPMMIMTNDVHFADKHFKLIKNTLYSEVYNYNAEED